MGDTAILIKVVGVSAMVWQERCLMSLRRDFVCLAGEPAANMAELRRRFAIIRQAGYKWLARYAEAGEAGLADRSQRPVRSPGRTATAIERVVCEIRRERPAWGGRKIRAFLRANGEGGLLPAASTMTDILRRHGLLAAERPAPGPYKRFEAVAPNCMWQMDFKGHFALDGRPGGGGVRCWPLTVLDDHSRFNIAIRACTNERDPTVRGHLAEVFERFGLPDTILTDNGQPWGHSHPRYHHTRFSVWLMRLGIKPLHSKPRHPQTVGKLERMHRTLDTELLQGRQFEDFDDAQRGFDRWREDYNHQRPHEALDMATPASRYRMSRRAMPATLPEPVYLADDLVGKIRNNGCIRLKRPHTKTIDLQLSSAFAGQTVAIRPTVEDGLWQVWFATFKIAQVDIRRANNMPCVTHLTEQL